VARCSRDTGRAAQSRAKHKTVKVKRRVLRHPRLHLHFVPTSLSWLSKVERWFKDFWYKRVIRGTLHSELDPSGAMKL
jgi:hypothetical protein